MRILITVDPEVPVPPIYYGGIERLVDSLITAYSQRGHEVHLLAHKDSTARYAKDIIPWPKLSSRGILNIMANAHKLHSVYGSIRPDIIHSFSRLLYTYPVLLTSSVPFVQTYERPISPHSTRLASWVGGDKITYTCCGEHMLRHLKHSDRFSTVHNFTDTTYFTPGDNVRPEHLMFLGRIEDIKGTREAVDAALAAGYPLIIAGNIEAEHQQYFDDSIKQYLDDSRIKYVGPVNDEQKRYYLQRAKAFLFPIKWEEPFGIVMAEAMACGTPVIGFRRGSVPEVIEHGKTGYVVDDTREMIDAISMLDRIDRNRVREECVSRFSLEVICDKYLELFRRILSQ